LAVGGRKKASFLLLLTEKEKPQQQWPAWMESVETVECPQWFCIRESTEEKNLEMHFMQEMALV
jgi:hypothetical protein